MNKKLLAIYLVICFLAGAIAVGGLLYASGQSVVEGDVINFDSVGDLDKDGVRLTKEAEETKNDDEFKVTLTIETQAIKEKSADIVLLLDCSGSMDGTRLASLKSSASDLVDILLNEDSNNRLALVTFSGSTTNTASANVKVVSELTQYNNGKGNETIKKGINAITAVGGTHTQSGIKTANGVLASSTADEKIIIVLTDGDPTFGYKPSTYTVKHTASGRNSTHDLTNITAYNYNSHVGVGYQDNYTMSAYCSTCRKNVSATAYCSTGAIFEANLGKDSGYTYYTIGYEVAEGSAGEETMKAVATGDNYYPADSTNLSEIFAKIGEKIDVVIEAGATVKDPMGDMLDLVYDGTELVKATNENLTDGDYYISSGSLVWNEETETFDWTIGAIYKNSPVTMTYKVFLDVEAPNFVEGNFYETNGVTSFTFRRIIDAEERTMNFNVPQVRGWVGSLNKVGYLANSNGEPINENGQVVEVEDAKVLYGPISIINERNGENRWRLGVERTITAETLNNYKLYGAETQTVIQNDKDDNDTVFFGYYIPNNTIKVEHYFENTEGNFELSYTENDSIEYLETKTASEYVLGADTQYVLPEGLAYDSEIKGSVASVSFTEAGQKGLTLKLYYSRETANINVEYYLENERVDATQEKTFAHMADFDKTVEISFGETIESLDFAESFINAMASKNIVAAYDSTNSNAVNSTTFDNVLTGPNPGTLKLYFVRTESNLVIEHYFQQDVKANETDNNGYPIIPDISVEGIIYVGQTKEDTDYVLENQVGYAYALVEGKSVKTVTCTAEGETLTLKIYYERVAEKNLKVNHYFEQLNGEYTINDSIDVQKKDVVINHKYFAADYDATNRAEFASQVVGYVYNKQASDNCVEFTADNANSELVLNLYYDLEEKDYTVEYYFETFDGNWNLNSELTENGTILFGETKTSENYEKAIEGYTYDSEDTRNVKSVVFDSDVKDLTLKLYYDLNRENVEIRYYKENPETGLFEEQTSDRKSNIEIRFGETISVENVDANYQNKYVKYNYAKTAETVENVNYAQCESGIKTLKLYYVAIPEEVKIEYYVESLKEVEGTITTEYVKLGDTLALGNAYYGDVFNGTDYHLDNFAELGYEFNANLGILSVSYDENGLNPSDTMKLYYNLKEGSVVVQYRDNAFDANDENGYLGQTVEADLYYGQDYSIESPKFEGYELVKAEESTISGNVDSENIFVIVYYQKKDVEYRVEHYYTDMQSYPQYQIDENATDCFTGKYFDVIDTDIAVKTRNDEYIVTSIENYPLTLNDSENVIKVFYLKNVYNYTVNYYFDNVLDVTLTDTFEAKLNDTIETYEDKVKTGYHFVKDSIADEGLVITGIDSEMVINVYYEKNTATFAVEHYFEQLNGEYILNNEFTQTGKEFAYGDTVYASDYVLTVKGYGYDAENENAVSVIEFNANEPSATVLKLYYNLGAYQLVVKYLDEEDNSIVSETYAESYLYGAQYNVESPVVAGYELSNAEDSTVEGTLVDNTEVIVYYKKANVDYTVNYYYDGILDENATETGIAKYNDTITEYVDKPKTGYEFSKVNPETLVLSANSEENVMNVYYVKSSFLYRVEYYYDDILALDLTEVYTALYGSEITTYEDKCIENYEFDQVNPEKMVVTENESENVLRVYYVSKKVTFKVEYYIQNENGEFVLDESRTVEEIAVIGEIKSSEDYNEQIDGYEYNSENPLAVNKIVVVEGEDGTLKLYYEKSKDETTTEKDFEVTEEGTEVTEEETEVTEEETEVTEEETEATEEETEVTEEETEATEEETEVTEEETEVTEEETEVTEEETEVTEEETEVTEEETEVTEEETEVTEEETEATEEETEVTEEETEATEEETEVTEEETDDTEKKVLGVVEELFSENPETGDTEPTATLVALIVMMFSILSIIVISISVKKKGLLK